MICYLTWTFSLVCLFGSSKAVLCSVPAETAFVSSPRSTCWSILSKSRNYIAHNQYAHTTSQQEQQQQPQHSSGRRWKNKRKRQTFLPSPVRNVSPREEHALRDQLGYLPSNVCCVSARSGNDDASAQKMQDNITDESSAIDTTSKGIGRPIAIQSYPLLVQLTNKSNNEDNQSKNYTPFPTLYWLTCPHVSRAISELERQGHVRNFQVKLESNNELATEWWNCHEEYASERWSILSEQDRGWLLGNDADETENRKRESMKGMIESSGVAGTDHRGLREDTANDKSSFVPSVKCLHSHYAHYRSQMTKSNVGVDGDGAEVMCNLVGKWTHELLLEHFPDLIL